MSLNNANTNATGQQCFHSMAWTNDWGVISYGCNICGWVKSNSVKSFTPLCDAFNPAELLQQSDQMPEWMELDIIDDHENAAILENNIAKITKELDMMIEN